MFQKIYIPAALTVFFALFLTMLPSSFASAEEPEIQGSVCQGAQLKFAEDQTTPENCQFPDSDPNAKLNNIIATIINLFSVIVGVVAVIMIIIGGFRYITSGGDSGNVSSAKNTILYAIVGLIIVALAQFIVKFILRKATEVR